jgi:hypothetical protein
MLMGVVAEMLRRSSILVLAIYARRRPRELERHDRQQEDKKKLFHDEIITRVSLQALPLQLEGQARWCRV